VIVNYDLETACEEAGVHFKAVRLADPGLEEGVVTTFGEFMIYDSICVTD
jgi:hypothetical protein